MKTHSSNANAQYNGCGILLCLAYPNDNNKVAIADAGTHSSNARVQEYGCGALWNLALNNDNNMVMIAEAGGIPTILDARRTHSSNATRVQEYGCGAVCI